MPSKRSERSRSVTHFRDERAAALLSATLGLVCALRPTWFAAWHRPLVAMFLLLGVLHGSLDWSIATRLEHGAPTSFFPAYLLAMAAVCLLWWLAPSLSLLGFVILSAYHFGEGELFAKGYRPSLGAALSRGAVVLFVPLLFHATAIQPVVRPWLPSGLANALVSHPLRLGLGLFFVVQHLVWLLKGPLAHRAAQETVRLTFLLAFFAACDILLGFATYFLFWHSHAHVHNLKLQLQPKARLLARWERTLPIALASLAGSVALVFFLQRFEPEQRWSWVFMALSAVTFPHALLVRRVLLPESAAILHAG